jgi:hypothetical protein
LEVDASVEGGGNASVDGFTEDVTDGLFNLGVDSLVEIVIGVNDALSLVITAGCFSFELVINFTCTSASKVLALTLIEVPVIISSLESA